MPAPSTIAIVGASLTGASAAATLREEGFDGRVVLLGAEPQLPYDRPPLSKAYLRGGMPFEKTLLRPAEFYGERGIEVRLGTTVARVDAEKRRLELQGGEQIEFDCVLVATGGLGVTNYLAGVIDCGCGARRAAERIEVGHDAAAVEKGVPITRGLL